METNRTVVCLGALTGFLTVVCVALAGILVWQRFYVEPSPQEDGTFVFFNTTNVTEIRLRFPGYFRTPEEQKRLELYNKKTPTPIYNVSTVYKRCFTNEYCERKPRSWSASQVPKSGNFTRRRRQISIAPNCSLDVYQQQDLQFHGCCVSHSYIDDPTYLPTGEPGQQGDAEIAQFTFLKQYFEMEECCQTRNCSGCQCSQTYYVTSAVVVKRFNKGTLYVTEYVRVPGCCKCQNIDRELRDGQ